MKKRISSLLLVLGMATMLFAFVGETQWLSSGTIAFAGAIIVFIAELVAVQDPDHPARIQLAKLKEWLS